MMSIESPVGGNHQHAWNSYLRAWQGSGDRNKTTANKRKKAKQPEYVAMADNGAAQT